MSKLHGRFVWHELMTSDTSAARAFYGPVAGWNMTDVPMPGMTYTILAAGQTQVGGLMAIPPDCAGMKPFWSGYIAVDDVDADAARLKRLGGKVCKEPADIPNVGRFAVVADPQGAVFNLFKSNTAGVPDPAMTPGRFNWNELHSTDWLAAFEFYRDMFGWQKGDSVDMGAMGVYQLFTVDGIGCGGMFNSPAAKDRCYWLFYTGVDDIDAAAGRVKAGGGAILNGPQQVPGGMWIIQATDPQGGMFALLGPKR
jgi:uncharacterized protein